jgi:hypothetical protein
MRKPLAQYVFLRRLLWHGMMGATLGVVCAGALLFSGSSALALLDGASDPSVRLDVLLTVGLAFGMAATLTGAMFLVGEEKAD